MLAHVLTQVSSLSGWIIALITIERLFSWMCLYVYFEIYQLGCKRSYIASSEKLFTWMTQHCLCTCIGCNGRTSSHHLEASWNVLQNCIFCHRQVLILFWAYFVWEWFTIFKRFHGDWMTRIPPKKIIDSINFFVGRWQGCIFRLTCSHPELTEDHVLTSAYVKIFRTVTRNAVNKSVWRKKDCSWLPLNKHAMNICLSSPRISWGTGKHLHVLHVLRTYSTCSYPG